MLDVCSISTKKACLDVDTHVGQLERAALKIEPVSLATELWVLRAVDDVRDGVLLQTVAQMWQRCGASRKARNTQLGAAEPS